MNALKFIFFSVWVLSLGNNCRLFGENRLVTTSPALTEIVFQLGQGEKLVGASEFSEYPDAAKALPRIGSLFQPSIEKILKLKADWVLIDREATPQIFRQQLESLKIRTLDISIRSVSDLFFESERIDKVIFNRFFSNEIENYRKHYLNNIKSLKRRFSFIAIAWHSPTYLIGPSTFLSDILTGLGGKNLVPANLPSDYPRVSEEWLLKHRPEVIFLLGGSENQKLATQAFVKKSWPGNDVKVIVLNSALFARASFTALENIPKILDSEL